LSGSVVIAIIHESILSLASSPPTLMSRERICNDATVRILKTLVALNCGCLIDVTSRMQTTHRMQTGCTVVNRVGGVKHNGGTATAVPVFFVTRPHHRQIICCDTALTTTYTSPLRLTRYPSDPHNTSKLRWPIQYQRRLQSQPRRANTRFAKRSSYDRNSCPSSGFDDFSLCLINHST